MTKRNNEYSLRNIEMEEGKDRREPLLFKRAEELLKIFKKGAEFTRELLKENERLRYRMAQLEQEVKALKKLKGEDEVEFLRKRVKELEKEKDELLRKYKEVEKENIDFAKRYVEVEEENNSLANLYIASYQLHSTLDFKEVLQIIVEIIINLIGGETFAIYMFDEKNSELVPVAAEGVELKQFPVFKLGEGRIGKIVKEGENFISGEYNPEAELDISNPIVVIPLKVKEQLVGAILLYRLLPQKKRLEKVDYELFTLLAGHAATALFSAKLYSDSERKLTTIQGFLQLLTK